MTQYEDEFEERFLFISDDILRKHMGDALRYVSELLIITKKYREPIRSTFYKTSIVYMASIIEAALHFCVLQLGFKYYEKEDWTYKDMKIIHEFKAIADTPYTQIVAGKRFKKKEKK
ncbi:MAG: hypothetical protein IIA88_09520 [Bacteroidetes bacterium]|nr:hypothetical protein [Bacteroidota bacterium]